MDYLINIQIFDNNTQTLMTLKRKDCIKYIMEFCWTVTFRENTILTLLPLK